MAMDMDQEDEVKRKMKTNNSNKGKIIAFVCMLLVVTGLLFVLLFPELPAKWFGKEGISKIIKNNTGSGQSTLIVEEKERYFDGNGIFDPLKGIKATDYNGNDIVNKVSYHYVSGKSLEQKQIQYVLYISENEKLTDSSSLTLTNYTGPIINIEEVNTINYEDLQNLMEQWIKADLLQGDDGFGNDATNMINYSYELMQDQQVAKITLSLVNQFQDYYSKTILVTVNDIPQYFE